MVPGKQLFYDSFFIITTDHGDLSSRLPTLTKQPMSGAVQRCFIFLAMDLTAEENLCRRQDVCCA
jgi:hypothetical protein